MAGMAAASWVMARDDLGKGMGTLLISPCTMDHLARCADACAWAVPGEAWHDPWTAEGTATPTRELLECAVGDEVAGMILGVSVMLPSGRCLGIHDLVGRCLQAGRERGMVGTFGVTPSAGSLPWPSGRLGFKAGGLAAMERGW